MAESIGICVSTQNNLHHVIGLSIAAKKAGKQVEIFFTGDGDMSSIGSSADNVDAMSKLYAISAIVFSLLSIWVFSIGALVVLVQLIYGLVKYFTVKENKSEYIHYFIGFAISMFGYIVIFSGSS